MDVTLLFLHLMMGLGIAAHGLQKLLGWFAGGGIKPAGAFLASIGFRTGHVFAPASGLGEFGGGLLPAVFHQSGRPGADDCRVAP